MLSSASKYRSLYNSVSFDKDEMQHIISDLNEKIRNEQLSFLYYRFTDLDVTFAITKLNAHKNDGKIGLMVFLLIILFMLERIYHSILHFCSPVWLLMVRSPVS